MIFLINIVIKKKVLMFIVVDQRPEYKKDILCASNYNLKPNVERSNV